uniref:Uncharacterized protein n=1 Tax=Physcomitrium patens TaxID=3218 RepID=A0A2K1KXF4_PHYPA|nr:hypothetical protein PHYPA_005446 [Physcomitrium patens]
MHGARLCCHIILVRVYWGRLHCRELKRNNIELRRFVGIGLRGSGQVRRSKASAEAELKWSGGAQRVCHLLLQSATSGGKQREFATPCVTR